MNPPALRAATVDPNPHLPISPLPTTLLVAYGLLAIERNLPLLVLGRTCQALVPQPSIEMLLLR